MLDASALATLLPTLPLQPITGVVYRAVRRKALVGDPPYPEVLPLYDRGPAISGARYTPKGSIRSLYLAADPETALAEVNQAYAKLRRLVPPVMAPILACVIYSANLILTRVLDLTDPIIQAAVQTDTAELCAPWREAMDRGFIPPTQQLGQTAFDCNLSALRFPSAQLPGHACFVVYSERLIAPEAIEVDDPDGYLRARLP